MESFSFNIEIEGIQKLLTKLENATKDTVIKDSLYQSGLMLKRWSQTNRLSGPRPQYLGVVTGRLRASITASKPTKIGNEYRQYIGTNVKYGPRHEFGTNIRPRPFLRPALEDEGNQREIISILTENINEALNK